MPSATTAVYTVSRPTALRTPVSQNRGTAFARGIGDVRVRVLHAGADGAGDGDDVGRVVGVARRRGREARQGREHGGALAVGRELHHFVVAIGAGDRRDPLAAMRHEVVDREAAAGALHCVDRGVGPRTGDVGVASAPGDCPQRLGERDVGDALSRHRLLGQAVPGTQVLGHARPLHRRGLPDGEAVLGQRDGRLQHGGEVEPPVARHELFPRVDHARHRHHQRAALVPGVGREAPLERQRRGRRARAVEADDGCSRLGDEREGVAADAGRVRLDDAEHRVGGHGRVDCTATLAERPERGLDREPVRGRHHRRPRPGGRRGGRRAHRVQRCRRTHVGDGDVVLGVERVAALLLRSAMVDIVAPRRLMLGGVERHQRDALAVVGDELLELDETGKRAARSCSCAASSK